MGASATVGGLCHAAERLIRWAAARTIVKRHDLQIGTVFLYYGPRRLPFGSRGLAIGRVIALDAESGIVHVCTYGPATSSEAPQPEILHLPILASSLEQSIQSVQDVQAFDPNSLDTVASWRARHESGEVGAFNVPLWEAEQLAWQATPEKNPETTLIEHAFPKRNPQGKLSVVEVACTPKS